MIGKLNYMKDECVLVVGDDFSQELEHEVFI